MGRSSKVAIWVWFAAVAELEAVRARHEPLEADAAAAQHAALGVQHDRPQVHDLALPDLLLGLDLRVVQAVLHVLVLEVALAGLVADGTVDGMVDEQELEGGAMGLGRLLALRVHHHALRHQRVAGDLELGHLLDLDQAHAAVPVDGRSGLPAEVRDLGPELQRRLDDGGPRRDLDSLPIDGAGDLAGLGGRGRSGGGRRRRGGGRRKRAWPSSRRSPVQLSGDDVSARDDGHRVGQGPTLDHLRERLVRC